MKKTERAVKLTLKAMSERLIADGYERSGINPGATALHNLYAENLRKEAEQLMKIDRPLQKGSGGEILPSEDEDLGIAISNAIAHDTLGNPDMTSLDASRQRLRHLMDAEAVSIGLDAAQSIKASNSLEKMLAHQLALCHSAALKTISEAQKQNDTIGTTRLLNAGTRLMKTFQEGLQTLHKIRHGNRQTMVVQHVNVSEGGQAVVAGEVGGTGKGEE